jgi:YidC/Oxa1 family membrane protein insertase
MESNQKDSARGGLSSILPVFLVGAAVILLMQVMNPKPEQTNPTPRPVTENMYDATKYGDFEFPKGPGTDISIETGHFVAKLSSQGGRITGMYLESHDNLTIPQNVITVSDDPVARKYEALEVTRGNGMDFQFHVYADEFRPEQLGIPPLNEARFRLDHVRTDEETGIQEVRFSLPLRFVRKDPAINHRLELVKIFRFLPKENYFHQVSVLRNAERDEFVYGGDLFFKPFGDMGPLPDVHDARTLSSFGRFYYYNDELENRSNHSSAFGGGCLPFGCGSDESGPYTSKTAHPNTLEFMGVTSRYFFAYTQFLGNQANPLHTPDGIKMRNAGDPVGREAFTAFFNRFRLAPASAEKMEFDGRASVARLQQERPDALLVDNKVYVGVRSEEGHAFHNPDLMEREFGAREPNDKARSVIYTSSFLAIFSMIRDGIVVLMRWVYLYTGNYGWAIIIIAVSFKLVTWPLNQMQAKSMKRMSALKPEMERINEKYADNPQEKQKKVMQLYKDHNVNPAKGCLPILIQMPVFIALYSAFSESVELWRSPFVLWMTDLSAPDTVAMIPYIGIGLNILPLMMVTSQLVQQRFTTVVTDPQQKMLMYLMPFMMLFFFWEMPSGVTLYWTVQNVIAIVWQIFANKFSDDDDPAKARPVPAR